MVALVSAATGIAFVDDGLSTEIVPSNAEEAGARRAYQPENYGDRWAPVLIGWRDLGPDDVAALLLGGGGNTTAVDAKGNHTFVTGTVMSPTSLPRVPRKQVLMHEFGHVMGLDHVDDVRQMMVSHAGFRLSARWGAGDLAGLKLLGRDAGCLPESKPG